MDLVLNIIYSLLIIGLVILVHEFGHFIIAKKNGVHVVEFFVGMGPNICSFVKNGTRYSLKWIPFGGACVMLGNADGLPDEEIEKEIQDDDRAYNNKSAWARISITAAGPIFNFLLALLIAIVLNALGGVDLPVLSQVEEGYPGEAAGLQAGDEIVKVDGHRITFYRDLTLYMNLDMTPGKEIPIVYERDGKQYETSLTPQWDEELQRYRIGIVSNGYTKLGVWGTIKYGFSEVGYNMSLVFKSLGMLFSGQAGLNDLSGPVGIANMVGDVVEQSKPGGFYLIFLNLLNFTMFISANLGVMNLLPIPAIDGGKLVFLLIEAVRGKPVAKEKEGLVHVVGFVLLMILMVVVLFNDIRKLFI